MQTSRILAVVAASFALLAQAQYPNKPIEMILPIAPGGGLDIQARLLAELAEAELRQRIVIVNKPGAGGTIGVSLVTQAKPDGYTLGAVWSGPLTASPHNQPVPYTLADYVPLVQFSKAPFVVCVAPDFPADTGAQLIAHLKQNPGKYSYGNEGAGGTLDLGLARIFAALGVSQLPIPFAGAADTARNFAGGHITMYAGGIASILPLAKAGKAKCLMMTSAARNPLFPAAAGLDDLGVGRAETVFWRAIIAPKGLPDDVRRTLETAFTNAAKSAKFTEFLAGLGEVPASLSGAALADYTSAEFNALGALAKSAAKPKQ